MQSLSPVSSEKFSNCRYDRHNNEPRLLSVYILPMASGFKTLLGLPAAKETISSTTTA
jgi:hypothetical protein